jgi:hypothetical protein
LYWLQAALNVPLAPGARVLAVSSGAATNGSPLSGGYAGAKRMLWFMTRYANELSRQRGLGIRFQTAVPMQIVGGTGVGDEASAAYAQAAGVSRDAFLARFGTPISPRQFGEQIVSILQDPAKASGNAFGLKGDTGITVLESGEPA